MLASRAQHRASFRDPSGFVFEEEGRLVRHINEGYLPHYEALKSSGLYASLTDQGLLIPHEEASKSSDQNIYPERVRFISYPYEWSFGLLKEAALATLRIQQQALDRGMWLKDASAYNIQFHRGRALLIDTLSFEIYPEGAPWPAYRQFCEHFLAPLAMMSLVDIRLGRLQSQFIDGIPLNLCSKLLPGLTKIQPGLGIHIHAHGKAQVGHASDKGSDRPSRGVSKMALLGLIDSLQATVQKLDWKPEGTEWATYYENTNYSIDSFAAKKRIVREMLGSIQPGPTMTWDLGANSGEFSQIASDLGSAVISWDVDPAAVEHHFRSKKRSPDTLPLIQDLTNPSSGMGWANQERDSLFRRGPADAILALALLHHLAIGNNVPLKQVAESFSSMAKWAIIEFVPKTDSQVQRLLSTRNDIYDRYSQSDFEHDFQSYYEVMRTEKISETERTLYLLRSREF